MDSSCLVFPKWPFLTTLRIRQTSPTCDICKSALEIVPLRSDKREQVALKSVAGSTGRSSNNIKGHPIVLLDQRRTFKVVGPKGLNCLPRCVVLHRSISLNVPSSDQRRSFKVVGPKGVSCLPRCVVLHSHRSISRNIPRSLPLQECLSSLFLHLKWFLTKVSDYHDIRRADSLPTPRMTLHSWGVVVTRSWV